MTISNSLANGLLDHTFGHTALTAPAHIYVQLHTGLPGASGTDNVFAGPAREICDDWETCAYGWIRNTADILWEDITAPSVDYEVTHCSIWDDVSAGVFLADGWLDTQDTSAPKVNTNDNLLIPAYYLFVKFNQ